MLFSEKSNGLSSQNDEFAGFTGLKDVKVSGRVLILTLLYVVKGATINSSWVFYALELTNLSISYSP